MHACVHVCGHRTWGGSGQKYSIEKHQEISQDCNKKSRHLFFPQSDHQRNQTSCGFCVHLLIASTLLERLLGLLMLLRLVSTAFKNISSLLAEFGKPGSQVWIRVSLLSGTEFCWAVSQPMTRNKLRGKTISFAASLVFWGFSHQRRNKLWNMIIIHSFHSRLTQKACATVCFLKSKSIHLHI